MSTRLDEMISSHIIKSNKRLDVMPFLMANLMIIKWPRPHNKAIGNSNSILETIMNAVLGWIEVIKEYLSSTGVSLISF